MAEYTLFSIAHGAQTMRDHIVGYKTTSTNLQEFVSTKVYSPTTMNQTRNHCQKDTRKFSKPLETKQYTSK